MIDLEIELGVQLLNRTTQSATPTEVGHRYYERCLVILAEIENAETSVSQFQVEAPGLLRVNAPMSFGTMFLGRLMGQFMAHHPDLQIELVLSDRRPTPDSRVTRSPNEIAYFAKMGRRFRQLKDSGFAKSRTACRWRFPVA